MVSVKTFQCPFCGCHECSHFIGWTENGRQIELVRSHAQDGDLVQDTDQFVKTGAEVRVYRLFVSASG